MSNDWYLNNYFKKYGKLHREFFYLKYLNSVKVVKKANQNHHGMGGFAKRADLLCANCKQVNTVKPY